MNVSRARPVRVTSGRCTRQIRQTMQRATVGLVFATIVNRASHGVNSRARHVQARRNHNVCHVWQAFRFGVMPSRRVVEKEGFRFVRFFISRESYEQYAVRRKGAYVPPLSNVLSARIRIGANALNF